MLPTSHTIEEKISNNVMDRQGHTQRTNQVLGTTPAGYAGSGFVQFMKLWL